MVSQAAKKNNSLLSDAQKQYDLCVERLKTMGIEPKLLSNMDLFHCLVLHMQQQNLKFNLTRKYQMSVDNLAPISVDTRIFSNKGHLHAVLVAYALKSLNH